MRQAGALERTQRDGEESCCCCRKPGTRRSSTGRPAAGDGRKEGGRGGQRRKDRVRDTPGGDPAPSSLQAAVPHHTTRIPRAPSASRFNFPRANGLGARVAFVQKQQRGKKRSEGHHCPRMPRQSDTTRGHGPNIVPHSGFPSLPCKVLLGKAQQARRAGKGGATHERNPRPRKAAGPGGGAGRV